MVRKVKKTSQQKLKLSQPVKTVKGEKTSQQKQRKVKISRPARMVRKVKKTSQQMQYKVKLNQQRARQEMRKNQKLNNKSKLINVIVVCCMNI